MNAMQMRDLYTEVIYEKLLIKGGQNNVIVIFN